MGRAATCGGTTPESGDDAARSCSAASQLKNTRRLRKCLCAFPALVISRLAARKARTSSAPTLSTSPGTSRSRRKAANDRTLSR